MPRKNAKNPKDGGDAGWWAAFVALFATSSSGDPKADGGSGGEAMPADSSGDAGADGGGGDGGGGDGGGGGD